MDRFKLFEKEKAFWAISGQTTNILWTIFLLRDSKTTKA